MGFEIRLRPHAAELVREGVLAPAVVSWVDGERRGARRERVNIVRP